MRTDSSAPVGLLLVGAAIMAVAAAVLWAHPELLARRNFPFNIFGDESTPRRGIVVAPFLAMALGLVILAIAG
jgi:hypothetical protein